MFGRPGRVTGLENERTDEVVRQQIEFLAQSRVINKAIAESPRLDRLLAAAKSDAEILDELFLAALSRLPRDAEKQQLGEYLAEKEDRRLAMSNVLWAILNTNDFLLKM